MKELNLKPENQDRTFGFSSLYIPDNEGYQFATHNIPAGDDVEAGQALSGLTKEGILLGLELAKPDLGPFQNIENLCFAYAVICFDKKELESGEKSIGILLGEQKWLLKRAPEEGGEKK